MKPKHLANGKQTVKLQPSKESLPKLHCHNKESTNSMTLKKCSRLSKLSLSMINGKTDQSMISCSRLKNLNTQKYLSKVILTKGKQLHKDGVTLSLGSAINNSIQAQSMIPKQRYKPVYAKNKQTTFAKRSKKSNLLTQTLNTQQYSQTDSIKEATTNKQQQTILNMSSSLSGHQINNNSLCSDIQKGQFHHSAGTQFIQLQEILETELMIDDGVNIRGDNCLGGENQGERQNSEWITSHVCDTNIYNNNNKGDKNTIGQPTTVLKSQSQPLAATQSTVQQLSDNTLLHAQQFQALRRQLKERESQIMNLWMIINSIQSQTN